MQLIDGASGQARWVRKMCPDTKLGIDLDHVLAAPDLDGDGVRDLIAVSQVRRPESSRDQLRVPPRARACSTPMRSRAETAVCSGPGTRT